jgi:5-methylcytosine-specific restriction endonuclease McrA
MVAYMAIVAVHRLRATRVRGGQRRRSRLLEAQGFFTAADQNLIYRLQGGRCLACGSEANLHLDHALPLARGGSNWPWNLRYLCRDHNLAKGSMTDSEYLMASGIMLDEPPMLTLLRTIMLAV